MTVKLLAEQHLEFLRLKGGCTGSSESIHVNMPHCWKIHVMAQMTLLVFCSKDIALFVGISFLCIKHNSYQSTFTIKIMEYIKC